MEFAVVHIVTGAGTIPVLAHVCTLIVQRSAKRVKMGEEFAMNVAEWAITSELVLACILKRLQQREDLEMEKGVAEIAGKRDTIPEPALNGEWSQYVEKFH
jgi:hypothetical protein